MPRQNMNLLCTYRYDPLDRLVACATSAQASTQRFYLRDRLATEIQGTVQHSIMQHDDLLLAQQQRRGSAAAQASLLATDQQRSVLTLLDTNQPHAFAYMPYGYCLVGSGWLSLLGFNGERPDSVTGWYLLGNGYRAFNPVLMRFNSPDSWSPFGKGGLNSYAYCSGDPVNRIDPNGHWSIFAGIRLIFRSVRNLVNRLNPFKHAARSTSGAQKNVGQLATLNVQQNPAPRIRPTAQSTTTPPSRWRPAFSRQASTSHVPSATSTVASTRNNASVISQPGVLNSRNTNPSDIYNEVYQDTQLIIQHMPPEATPAQLGLVTELMSQVRLGGITNEEAIHALEPFAQN